MDTAAVANCNAMFICILGLYTLSDDVTGLWSTLLALHAGRLPDTAHKSVLDVHWHCARADELHTVT